MNVYIDYNNFCSYLETIGTEGASYCDRVLRQNYNIYFTFDKNELKKLKGKQLKAYHIWERNTVGRNGLEVKWNVKFPCRPISNIIHESFTRDQLSSIYMLEGEGVDEWANAGGLLVATVGTEFDTIKKLFIDNNYYQSIKKYTLTDMEDWSIYGRNNSPCTDIIISDLYLFAQNEEAYKNNIYALLTQLSAPVKGIPINIVIFTMKYYRYYKSDGQSEKIKPAFELIIPQIKSLIKEIVGVEPNVTIVKIGNVEHDRTIFTNYRLYTSGSSFSYFNPEGYRCTNGRWFDISSTFDKNVMTLSYDFLNGMQALIKDYRTKLSGDKKSNFLDFKK